MPCSAALARAHARAEDVERFVHGMTVGTNALLEGKVARTALLATEGFTDIEELGRQARAELYRLCAGHPAATRARRAARGRARSAAAPTACCARSTRTSCAARDRRRAASSTRPPSACSGASAIPSTSVALRRGARRATSTCPCRTRRPASSASTSAARQPSSTPRSRRSCARYLERLAERAADAGLPVPEIMLSGGGVAPAAVAARHGSWTVLSGPAGGAVGAAAAAAETGAPDAVCLDMGGTSSRRQRRARAAARARAAGARSAAARSRCRWWTCTPSAPAAAASPGATPAARCASGRSPRAPCPGPACYGRGGERADGHRREPAARPSRPGRRRSRATCELDREAAERAVGALAERARSRRRARRPRGSCAWRTPRWPQRRARDDGRARHRPARARAARVRRRRPDARRGRRRRARDAARGRARGLGRAVRARAGGLGTPRRCRRERAALGRRG